jgi:hypothetical protein
MKRSLASLPFLLVVSIAGCGSGQTKASDAPVPPPVTAPTSASECHQDSDCVVAIYDAPADAAACCALDCERPVVTVAEATRRQAAWEQVCSAVRCQPPSCEVAAPTPVCRDEQCMARPAE